MMLMRRQKDKMSEIKIQMDQLQAQHDQLQKEKQKVIIRTTEEILNIIYKYKGDV